MPSEPQKNNLASYSIISGGVDLDGWWKYDLLNLQTGNGGGGIYVDRWAINCRACNFEMIEMATNGDKPWYATALQTLTRKWNTRSCASVAAVEGDARKLTLPELNHLSALLEAERESGEYAGPREQYYARTERLIKWCHDQTGDKKNGTA